MQNPLLGVVVEGETFMRVTATDPEYLTQLVGENTNLDSVMIDEVGVISDEVAAAVPIEEDKASNVMASY
jgi:hypothetical protein